MNSSVLLAGQRRLHGGSRICLGFGDGKSLFGGEDKGGVPGMANYEHKGEEAVLGVGVGREPLVPPGQY